MQFTKDQIETSLRTFKSRRDNLLHEDTAAFNHHLERFLEFCNTDPLTQTVLAPFETKTVANLNQWWADATKYRTPQLSFPSDPDDELAFRYQLIKMARTDVNHILRLGLAHGKHEAGEAEELFRTLIVRQFAEELSQRLGAAADLATPEARAVQAVPLNRIPSSKEAKIFLSHKSVDKPLVQLYYQALKTVGFEPWLDEPNMPAGSNLERELIRGFEESCAAVFFITANFKDQQYLATEIDYAILQKRKKEKKFAIITLRYADASPVPGLLMPYVYRNISNDLDGFHELVKALPIELGPIRWKADVV
jgi:TIR domain